MTYKLQGFITVSKLLATHLPNTSVLQHKDDNPLVSEQREFPNIFYANLITFYLNKCALNVIL